jgi:hypothetical protein
VRARSCSASAPAVNSKLSCSIESATPQFYRETSIACWQHIPGKLYELSCCRFAHGSSIRRVRDSGSRPYSFNSLDPALGRPADAFASDTGVWLLYEAQISGFNAGRSARLDQLDPVAIRITHEHEP